MSIRDKFLDFIGISEAEEAGEEVGSELLDEEETVEAAPAPKKTLREQRLQGGGDTVSMPNVATQKMIVYHPVTYEDAQSIIDNLRSRKPVIVNMEDLDVATAQRILDFLSGALYALSGTIHKISRNIFVMAPNNYDVVGNDGPSAEDFDM